MIVTEHFVFVHMHKTGGQTINNVLSRCLKGRQVIGYHYPYSLVPEQFGQLPLVGFVRNPWDWYVSWYAFNRRPKAKNALFAVCSDGGKGDFKTSVVNLIQLGEDSTTARRYRDALVSVLPKTLRGNRGVGLTKACIANFVDNKTGYYSWLFDRMFGDTKCERVHIGKFENLEADLVRVLKKLSVPDVATIERVLKRSNPQNSSQHGHYSEYYDAELKELVGRKDSRIIEQFGYEFEQDQNTSGVVSMPSTYAIDGSFKKLLDRAKNYLLLSGDYNIHELASRVARIPDDQWTESGREQRYMAHTQTQSLLLIHDDDMRHKNPTHHEQYYSFEQDLKPLMDLIASYYENDGYFIRALFAKLLPGEVIVPHIDSTFSLLHCHRVHVPIVTNDQVTFIVGGERKHMRPGEIWEINNATAHSVENRSEHARIHLIVDWVSNSTLRALERRRRPIPLQPTGMPSATLRNEPCPCGSNRKFKYCHGALT
ncbi:MAG: aspartyl/asparaginyl beta-hydroxylase domain-containing protein [Gammaproteobacteria bacterium]|nr:aspartyl/asparaginyl beta-hydroxylase domain-containing protein [Gammaproteobacteria bacterium]